MWGRESGGERKGREEGSVRANLKVVTLPQNPVPKATLTNGFDIFIPLMIPNKKHPTRLVTNDRTKNSPHQTMKTSDFPFYSAHVGHIYFTLWEGTFYFFRECAIFFVF